MNAIELMPGLFRVVPVQAEFVIDVALVGIERLGIPELPVDRAPIEAVEQAVTIAALVGHSRGSVTSRYIHTVDTALIMAADSIAGYIQGLLDGVAFSHTSYALDRASRKSALAHFLGQTNSSVPESSRVAG